MKLVCESLDDILKPKDLKNISSDVITYVDELIKNFRIFKFTTTVFKSGKGTKIYQKFLQDLPGKVDAGPNFYSSSNDEIKTVIQNVYGIKTLNINSIMGPVINVPHIKDWVAIKGDGIFVRHSLYVYLKKQKVIFEYYRNKNGGTTGTDPEIVYFDYDHLKETLLAS
jgi:hypothetical protein